MKVVSASLERSLITFVTCMCVCLGGWGRGGGVRVRARVCVRVQVCANMCVCACVCLWTHTPAYPLTFSLFALLLWHKIPFFSLASTVHSPSRILKLKKRSF